MKTVISAIWPYAAFFVLGAVIAWFITDNVAQREISALKSTHAAEMKSVSDEAARSAAESLARVTALQDNLAALNKQSQEKLTHAQAANDKLRADVADGKRRVLIAQGKLSGCSRPAGTGASTGGLGDETEVGLTTEAGQDVLDIRRGIIDDQAKVDYLQQYIRQLQAKGFIAGN